jgi:hypothetical protein
MSWCEDFPEDDSVGVAEVAFLSDDVGLEYAVVEDCEGFVVVVAEGDSFFGCGDFVGGCHLVHVLVVVEGDRLAGD